MSGTKGRRIPIGAEVSSEGVAFRVWAPKRRKVHVVVEDTGASVPLSAEEGGYFSAVVKEARAGSLYRFRLDEDPTLYPDPASRFQPSGPHGPSEVIDPSLYAWGDAGWQGIELRGQVIYELHVGTFTREGTYSSAIPELRALAELGVTLIELMPVADFPGRFGWGYDGVNLFAPTRLYGRPDDLRKLVDEAHALGMGVILDVVYNHLGPDGNYLAQFADAYFTKKYPNEWGDSIDYDGEQSAPVRELFVSNAGYWTEEFHFDGLRLDATQSMHDASARHVLADITLEVRRRARGRSVLLVGENEPQEARLIRPLESGGFGLDALWNDDFHHTAVVALTGRNEAYYTDYCGSPQELISALKWGFLFQGQRYKWQKKRRGTPAYGEHPSRFVVYLQNHDQIANSGLGLRIHHLAQPATLRAMTALMMLSACTPMLFQGQEFGASAPFLYFADHEPRLAELVQKGRTEFLAQFPSLAANRTREFLLPPHDLATFERCKLDHRERDSHRSTWLFFRDLLALRRDDPIFSQQRSDWMHGAVLGQHALCLRYLTGTAEDVLVLINLGKDLELNPAPEPLLAPPSSAGWELVWSSEDPLYGGAGTAPPERDDGWHVQGNATVVLRGKETVRS
jgi:maltooligosyltrehalose trehalohydrolase